MIVFSPIPTINLGFYQLSTHGLIIAIGFLSAEILARRAAGKRGLSADLVDNAAIIAVLAGLVGARIVYIAVLGRGMSFWQMLEIWNGGLSSHGGYVFGILAGLLYFKWKKVDIFKYADVVLPFMLIGWAIGRIGCFLNWDSYGKLTRVPWAIVVYGEPRHATQLYESFGYLVAFFLQVKVTATAGWKKLRPGSTGAFALALFALVRVVVDFYRDDSASYLLLSRLVTLVLIALCIAFIVWPQKKGKVVV